MGFGYAGMIKPSPAQVFTGEMVILIIAQMVGTSGLIWFIGKQLIKKLAATDRLPSRATCLKSAAQPANSADSAVPRKPSLN